MIGLLLVILFMACLLPPARRDRRPGPDASTPLLTFALFKLIPVTLTLPGIAGFVLSIGVAVDANILIFSRLKEELRAGKRCARPSTWPGRAPGLPSATRTSRP